DPCSGHKVIERRRPSAALDLSRSCVSAIDQFFHALAARARAKGGVLFHSGCFGREIVIFDCIAEPTRIIAGAKVEEPGVIIDTVGQLQEGCEIFGAQVECGFWSTKVEASVLAQLTFCVLAGVALLPLLWSGGSDHVQPIVSQHEDLARFKGISMGCRQITTGRLAKLI